TAHGLDPRTAIDGALRERRAEGLETPEAHATPLLEIGLEFSEHRGGPRPDLSARTTVRDERLAIPSIEVRGPLNEVVHDGLSRERQDRRIVGRCPGAFALRMRDKDSSLVKLQIAQASEPDFLRPQSRCREKGHEE